MVGEYLLGRRQPMNDLMAWNADATRMPYRMHSEYLRRLFLKNDLFEGRLRIDGQPVSLADIRVPTFVLATETDHVAPWKSVHKINLVADDVTFVLTSGGHNAGIVSEPGHPGRHFRIARRVDGDTYVTPDDWAAATPVREGSWWPAWADWLEAGGSGRAAPPPMGAPQAGYAPLAAAPGSYVLEP
jgi:polyhydroxyalkanoate synthase